MSAAAESNEYLRLRGLHESSASGAIYCIKLGRLNRIKALQEFATGWLNSLIRALAVTSNAGARLYCNQTASLLAATVAIELVFAAITGGGLWWTTSTEMVGFRSLLGLATVYLT